MKYILFFTALFLFVNITAQEFPKESKVFIRLYDNSGKKIGKGNIHKITEDALILRKGKKFITLKSNEIDYLKTKRTKGHSTLIGAAPGGALIISSIIFGDDAYGTAFGVAGGTVLSVLGAGAGYIASLFKKSEKIMLSNDIIKWKEFKNAMEARYITSF